MVLLVKSLKNIISHSELTKIGRVPYLIKNIELASFFFYSKLKEESQIFKMLDKMIKLCLYLYPKVFWETCIQFERLKTQCILVYVCFNCTNHKRAN